MALLKRAANGDVYRVFCLQKFIVFCVSVRFTLLRVCRKVDRDKRKKSVIWKYFLGINPTRPKCEICSSIYSFKAGTTSHLARHIKAKHPTALLIPEGPQLITEDEVESVVEERTPLFSTSGVVPSTSYSVPSTSTKEPTQPPTKKQRTGRTTISDFVTRPLPVSKQKILVWDCSKINCKTVSPFQNS